ncbi:MAG: tRNA (adenosine(37)-N6)-dimethylallyltransferase MiaA, partial [Clostridia bacterium]|nr:tRNA (adenosine(37)-N6)-dimethylallyltransferase MiaA [Clostridia bacterium]
DSMQVYRGLDIGTAKLKAEEMGGIRHHMLDVAEPDTVYTVSDYCRDARLCMDEMISRRQMPILVGGTGLYLNALSVEMTMGDEGADPALREALRKTAETEEGRAALFARLREIDPQSAEKLHPNDVHRVVRAIEIYETTGRRKSEMTPGPEGPYHILVYGLSKDREVLYDRLNRRVDRMLEAGWLEEVRGLMARGIRFDRTDGGVSQAIGYPELACVIGESMDMDRAIELTKRNTRRYAKRQWTWFRHDPRVTWFEQGDGTDLCGAVFDRVCLDLDRSQREQTQWACY